MCEVPKKLQRTLSPEGWGAQNLALFARCPREPNVHLEGGLEEEKKSEISGGPAEWVLDATGRVRIRASGMSGGRASPQGWVLVEDVEI